MKFGAVSSFLPLLSIAISIASISFLIGTPNVPYLSSNSAAIYWLAEALQLKLLTMVVTSELEDTLGTCKVVLKQSTTSRSFKVSFIEVVPMISSFRFSLGGFFSRSTIKAYKIGFENRGPMCTNLINRSISSRIISDRLDL